MPPSLAATLPLQDLDSPGVDLSGHQNRWRKDRKVQESSHRMERLPEWEHMIKDA